MFRKNHRLKKYPNGRSDMLLSYFTNLEISLKFSWISGKLGYLLGAPKLVWGRYSILTQKKSLHQNHVPSKIRGKEKCSSLQIEGFDFFSPRKRLTWFFVSFDVQLISSNQKHIPFFRWQKSLRVIFDIGSIRFSINSINYIYIYIQGLWEFR